MFRFEFASFNIFHQRISTELLFYLGITPLDSAQEGDDVEDGDSVFEHDVTHNVLRTFNADYFPPPPTLLLNNNALPHPSNWDCEINK